MGQLMNWKLHEQLLQRDVNSTSQTFKRQQKLANTEFDVDQARIGLMFPFN